MLTPATEQRKVREDSDYTKAAIFCIIKMESRTPTPGRTGQGRRSPRLNPLLEGLPVAPTSGTPNSGERQANTPSESAPLAETFSSTTSANALPTSPLGAEIYQDTDEDGKSIEVLIRLLREAKKYSTILQASYEVLKGTAWWPLLELWGDVVVETWLFTLPDADGMHTSVSSNGGASKRTASLLMRKVLQHRGSLNKSGLEQHLFLREMLPSLLRCLTTEPNQTTVTATWGVVINGMSQEVYFEFRCSKCRKLRYMRTLHARTFSLVVPTGQRECRMVGLTCNTAQTTEVKHLELQTIKEFLSNSRAATSARVNRDSVGSSVIIDCLSEMGQGAVPHGEVKESCDTLTEGEETVAILKALGKQTSMIKPYEGSGGAVALQAWAKALQRYFDMFKVRADSNKVLMATCYLEGQAKE